MLSFYAHHFRNSLLAGAACIMTAAAASCVQGATIINADFETGTFASAGLFDYNSQRTPSISDGEGINGSKGLYFENNGGSATASMTIAQVTTFSMFGKFNGNNNTNGGTLAFGWTKASAPFNTYNGTATGVVATDTVIVGLARTDTGAFTLSAANGGLSLLTGTTSISNTVQSLNTEHWYRLEGTILYDANTGTFTFQNISLDDFGEEGLTEEAANVLSGSGSVVSADFGTTGRGLFTTNRDRGIEFTDNYFMAVAVPEPAAMLLLGMGGFAFLLRRRRNSAVHH